MEKRNSLKDLPGVSVVVEGFDSVAEQTGFDSRIFRTDVELKLRMAGIKVLEIEDGLLPWLYLNVNTLHRETVGQRAYNIQLELFQVAYLRSQLPSDPESASEDVLPASTVWASTWSSGMLGFGSVASARDAVKDLVARFINDWLAVNPLNRTA